MPDLELTHVWKDQSGNVVAELYGGVSLIPEISKRQEIIDRYREALEKIAFQRRDYAPTLEACQSIAKNALKH